MDLFTSLFSIASNVPESEPNTSTPVVADGGSVQGCLVA
jgi:hypothetical protein